MKDSERIREYLRQIERALDQLDQEKASCCNTTMAQCHALVELGRLEKVSVNGLSEVLNLDKSTTSRTIQQLYEQNRVERTPSSEDRRQLDLTLTETGLNDYRKIESTMNSFFEQAYEAIPEASREQVVLALEILSKAIKTASK
jgi:DNA-binding MarR family transcriptional regulator